MIYNITIQDDVIVQRLALTCINSFTYYHESKYYRNVYKEILSATEGKWINAVKWFVSNSARAINYKAVGFQVSLRPQTYSNNIQKIGFRSVMNLINLLEGKGYIDIYKGGVLEWGVDEDGGYEAGSKSSSYIVLKEKYLDLWRGVRLPKGCWDKQEDDLLVQIRDRETRQNKSTQGVAGITKEKLRMKQFNEFLSKSDIQFYGEPIANLKYSRIFSDDLTYGGRLYAVGGGVQTIPQDIRRDALTIDGEPVVELDYKAIHPNICYQLFYNGDGLDVNMVLGEDFCPYSAPMPFLEINEDKIKEKEKLTGKSHKPVRELAKLTILISMNSDDRGKAVHALSNKIRKDRLEPIENQRFYGIEGIIPARRVCDALKEHNDFISSHFFSDSGIVLQKFDSDIMLEVVSRMLQKEHAVLCYHDSAITKASAEEDLMNAMQEAWVSVFGNDKFCTIEKK